MGYDFSQFVTMPIFKGIKKEELPIMLQCIGSHQKTYAKNQIIFLESQEIRTIGIILSGTIHMIKEDAEGHKTLLVCMKTGEIFGETFACGSSIDTRVNFVAATPCTVLFLPFYKVIHSCTTSCGFHHRLIENMVRLLGDKNQQLMSKIEVISKKTLRDKILCYLETQAKQFGNRHFTIPLGRLELADYLCADRSALTRELSSMRDDGLIDYDKNSFTLL